MELGPVVLVAYAIEGPLAVLQRTGGALLRIEDGQGAVLTAKTPDTGTWPFGLAALFPGSRVTEEQELLVRMVESPAVTAAPESVTKEVTWHGGDLAAVLFDVVKILDGADSTHGPLVEGELITTTGAAMVTSASPVLVQAFPTLYVGGLELADTPVGEPPSQTGRVTVEEQPTAVRDDLLALGRVASLNNVGVGIVIWVGVCVGMGAVAWRLSKRRTVQPALLLALPAGWWVTSVGLWPPAYILAILSVLILVGAGRLLTRIWPRG